VIDPRQDYEMRLQARKARLRLLQRRDGWLANLRLLVFVGGIAIAWAIFGAPAWPLATLAAPVVLFAGLMVLHERDARAAQRVASAVDYYERGIARLEDRWAGGGVQGEKLKPVGHVYAEDLDLFGEASLFELLCTARTRAGETALAQWLCVPAELAELSARQDAVVELRGRVDEREALAVAGGAVQPIRHPGTLEAWAESPARMPRGVWPWVFRAASVLPLVAGLIGWQLGGLGWGFLILGALPGLAAHRWFRGPVSRALHVNETALRELADLARVARHIEDGEFESAMPRRLQAELKTGRRTASRAIALLARLVEWREAGHNQLFGLVALVVLWEVHFAYALEWWRRRFGGRVAAWMRAVGEFEALCALATYAYEHPADPFPEIAEGAACFDGESLGHPLLPATACVRNSVRLGESPALLIVSGSNMSGKSTLLRTAGINAVLAMAGAPVRAARLRMSPVHVGASMHIVDSIQQGTSHFYAEILRLKAIQDLTQGPRPVLFLVDEILHGTNSHDRSLGAAAVVRGLVEAGAVGMVTTHDLALTSIADGLGARAANVHFVDHIENGRLVFDYVMRPGVVQRSNAVALMRQIGLDV
jgi:hypothetical protein